MPVVGRGAARMCLRLWRTCSWLSLVQDLSFGLSDAICCIPHVSKKERVRVAMRSLIGIEFGAVWLSQKGNVFRVAAGARARGRGVGCKVGFGVGVGVVVVLVGGGCGVVGMCVVDGVGVRVAGVFEGGGDGGVAGRMGLPRSERRVRRSGAVRSIVSGCGVVVAW